MSSATCGFDFGNGGNLSLGVDGCSHGVLVRHRAIREVSRVVLPRRAGHEIVAVCTTPRTRGTSVTRLVTRYGTGTRGRNFTILCRALSHELIPRFRGDNFRAICTGRFVNARCFRAIVTCGVGWFLFGAGFHGGRGGVPPGAGRARAVRTGTTCKCGFHAPLVFERVSRERVPFGFV